MSKVTYQYTVDEATEVLKSFYADEHAGENVDVEILVKPTVAHWPTLDLVPIQILNLLLVGKVDEAINYANDLYATTMSMYEVKEWIDSLQKRFFKPVDPNTNALKLLNVVPISVLNAISEERLVDATTAAVKYFNFSSTAAKDYVYNLRETYLMYFHKRMLDRKIDIATAR